MGLHPDCDNHVSSPTDNERPQNQPPLASQRAQLALRAHQSLDHSAGHRCGRRRSGLDVSCPRPLARNRCSFGCRRGCPLAVLEGGTAEWASRFADLHKRRSSMGEWRFALRLSRPHVQSLGHLSPHWATAVHIAHSVDRRWARGLLHDGESVGALRMRMVSRWPREGRRIQTVRVGCLGIRSRDGNDPGVADAAPGSDQYRFVAFGPRRP